MLNLLRCYEDDVLCFTVDTKMKVLERGMGVATVDLLIKNTLRKITFTRANPTGRRCQGKAFTSHSAPVLQAIFTRKPP